MPTGHVVRTDKEARPPALAWSAIALDVRRIFTTEPDNRILDRARLNFLSCSSCFVRLLLVVRRSRFGRRDRSVRRAKAIASLSFSTIAQFGDDFSKLLLAKRAL